MIENIEITGETCIDKIYAMRSRCVTEREYQCRHCNNDKQYECPRYRPANKTSVPIRRGIFANGTLAR